MWNQAAYFLWFYFLYVSMVFIFYFVIFYFLIITIFIVLFFMFYFYVHAYRARRGGIALVVGWDAEPTCHGWPCDKARAPGAVARNWPCDMASAFDGCWLRCAPRVVEGMLGS